MAHGNMDVPGGRTKRMGMSFEKLRVYQAAELLDAEVQRLIARMPSGHGSDVDHLRRAVASLLYNIAEAYGCSSPGRKCNHLEVSRGSSDEARAILRRLVARGALPQHVIEKAGNLTRAIAKMLGSWLSSLERRK